MPRPSPEERGAAAYRAGVKPPPPPATLSEAAGKFWKDIVNSKPADWFDPGSLIQLASYCEMAVQEEYLRCRLVALRESNEGGDAMRVLEKRIGLMSSKSIVLASKLRLTVQAMVAWESRKLQEKGPDEAANDRLVGGTAIWGEGSASTN